MNTRNRKIGHVHLKVRDIERSIKFYTELLGLTLTEKVEFAPTGRTERYAFLTYGDIHHDIALKEVGRKAESPESGMVGLFHFAIEVASNTEFKTIFRRLRDKKVETSPRDHGLSKVLYFNDPDGNGVEVYIDTRKENNRYRWDGKSTDFAVESLPD